MADQKFMIATRNKKGQIGYLSEGLSLPEFSDLFRSKGSVQVLVDYSPVINELHKLHKAASNEGILIKYNSMFNFWQEAKTYKKESIKISKSEELAKQANSLINELQLKLQKSDSEFSSMWNSSLHEQRKAANSIENDSNIYIDTLLCFIHSKASLDIESFKDEVVLSSYGKFLHELIAKIYAQLLREGRYQDSYRKYIAFERPNELQSYLDLDGKGETSDQFLLRILKTEKTYGGHDENQGPYREVSIRFTNFHHEFVSIVEVFRNLLHKTSSLNSFLSKLREGIYEWEDGSEFVDELRENINLLK